MAASGRACLIVGVLCLAAIGNDVAIAAPAELPGEAWIKSRANGYGRDKKTVADVRKDLLRLYRQTDIDGGGVSVSDYELKEQKESAAQRSAMLSRWLRNDLDGDGRVTRQELERIFLPDARRPIHSYGVSVAPTPDQIAKTLEKMVNKVLADDGDGDGDGSISFAEALSEANSKIATRSRRRGRSPFLVPLTLDRDGDGKVTESEYGEEIDRVLGQIDLNGDGRYSKSEISALREEVRQIRKSLRTARRTLRPAQSRSKSTVRQAAGCRFPKVPEAAKVILLGTYDGGALSTVTLGDDRQVVSMANIRIEPGDEPLYVVLTSGSPMIWQFFGNSDRVAAVAASADSADKSRVAAVGVQGLPKERIYLTPSSECLESFTQTYSTRATRAARQLRDLTGRQANIVLASQTISAVSLPSGVFDRTAAYENAEQLSMSGPGGPLWQNLVTEKPGGVVRIDAQSVVSRLVPKPYSVLPGEAGLARLVEEGALELVSAQEIVTTDGRRIGRGLGGQFPDGYGDNRARGFGTYREFRILKKIRFPAGLTGRRAMWFLLAPGVPKPEGDPGDSCLIKQETGKAIAGGRLAIMVRPKAFV